MRWRSSQPDSAPTSTGMQAPSTAPAFSSQKATRPWAGAPTTSPCRPEEPSVAEYLGGPPLIRNRYHLIKLLIPVSVAVYVVMLPLNFVIEKEHTEVFPFYSWRLFPSIPAWQTSEYALIVHSIDGDEVNSTRYLIPSENIRDSKALKLAVTACTKETQCDETVTEVLYPLILQSLGAQRVEFSIIKARIDLHDIQDNIDDIAAQKVRTTDFFQPHTIIGRWNTHVGRIR